MPSNKQIKRLVDRERANQKSRWVG